MKAAAGLLGAMMLGAGALYASLSHEPAPADPITTSAMPDDDLAPGRTVMQVHRIGGAGTCTMRWDDAGRLATADKRCAAVYAPLGDVSGWLEKPDGSVLLLNADGDPILELWLADGHAYESAIPSSVMLVFEPAAKK